MKTLLSILLFLSFISGAHAEDKYEQAMKKNLEKMDDCKTPADYLKVANGFERIALAEENKWLPYYYTSFNYILASYIDSTKAQKDAYLDNAVRFIQIADSLEPDNSEIYTLKGMLAQARMQIDPMSRWQKYGSEAQMSFERAIEADALNPRPEYLIGAGVYYTPKQFGGGSENAKPILEKSWLKFEKFIPADIIMPKWGKEAVVQLLKQINEEK